MTDQKLSGSEGLLLRRITGLVAARRVPFAAALLLSLIITAATLGQPWLLQLAIDHSITADTLPTADRLALLRRDTLLYALLISAVFVCDFAQTMLLQWLGQNTMHDLRQRLFGHLLKLDPGFFNRHATGRLVTRLTNDISTMNEMFTSVVVTLFNDMLRLFGILCVLCWMNLDLALIMMLFLPLALFITRLFARLSRRASHRIRSQLARLNSTLSESIAGISILQLFGQQETSGRHYATLCAEYRRRTFTQIRLFGIFMPLTELLTTTSIAVILWFGGGKVIQQHLSLGELTAFISYMRLFFQPLRELAQKYTIVQSALASAERIFALFDEESDCPPPQNPLRIDRPQGEVSFVGVNFGYNAEEPVLRDINLHLEPGKSVAIVGTTGSGKSTLVKLLLRFYDPDSGEILVDGINLKQLNPHELRSHIAVIFQELFILDDTLLANILLDHSLQRSEVEKILAETGIEPFVARLPDGLDTRIGDGGLELSTGQKQLLAFARMLCRNPAVLVLDEATAALDNESEELLEQVLEKSFHGRTSLIIAHRLASVRHADTIVVMEHGRIVEQGSHTELLAKGGRYARLTELDRSGHHDDSAV